MSWWRRQIVELSGSRSFLLTGTFYYVSLFNYYFFAQQSLWCQDNRNTNYWDWPIWWAASSILASSSAYYFIPDLKWTFLGLRCILIFLVSHTFGEPSLLRLPMSWRWWPNWCGYIYLTWQFCRRNTIEPVTLLHLSLALSYSLFFHVLSIFLFLS